MLYTRYDEGQRILIYDIESAMAIPALADLVSGIGPNALELVILSANVFSPFNRASDDIADNTKRVLSNGSIENPNSLYDIDKNPLYRAAYIAYEKEVVRQLPKLRILKYYEEQMDSLLNTTGIDDSPVAVEKKASAINKLQEYIDALWDEIFKQKKDKKGQEQIGKARDFYLEQEDKSVFEKDIKQLINQ